MPEADSGKVLAGHELLRLWGLPERFSPGGQDSAGRGLLALLAGYLCCLTCFEWTMLWGFAPYTFRPLVALLLTSGLISALLLHQLPPEQRPATAIPALTWLAVAAWPLRLSPITATVSFSLLVLIMLLGTLRASQAGIGLVLALAFALAALAGSPVWPMALLAAVLAGVEAGRGRVPTVTTARARREQQEEALARSVDISWSGFAALFKAAAPGEGERFATTLLADTASIIEAGGGRRVRGSDLNGTYRFPDEASMLACLANLERYHASVLETLAGAQAPLLDLVVSPRP